MEVKQIYKNLYLYIFPNQFELCSTFFRLQEFYESPIRKIRGKYFTYENFINTYAYLKTKKDKKVKFTYFSDWNGFNVPGNIVANFEEKFNNNYTDKETKLLTELGNLTHNNFYLIGVVKGQEETIKHEIAHGFYYLNKAYKKEMSVLIKQLSKRIQKQIKKKLLSLGYCKQVVKDETQTYLSTGIEKGMISIFDYILHWNLLQKFKRVFKKYYKEIDEK